jgi:anti-sigma regulatory factor (Ser/Thr protein kinase)
MQPPAALVLELEPSSESVPVARHAVTDWAREVLSQDLVEVVALLVSELATNAVIHARTPYTVTVIWERPRLHIEVADSVASHWSGERRDSDVGGWGLDILERLSDTWGIHEFDDRKAVWFELVETGV